MDDKKRLVMADGEIGDPEKVPQRLERLQDGTYAPVVYVENQNAEVTEVSLSPQTLAALENITAVVSNFPSSTEVSNDSGSPIPVSGTVALDAASLAALENVSVAINSIPEVEIKNDSGNPVPVSGTFFPATQPISGTVTVANPTAQGLTDSQLRAAPVVTTLAGSSTSTVTTYTTTTSSQTVLAANPNRKGAKFFSVTGTILLKYGTNATTASFSERIVTNGNHELAGPEPYKGVVTAVGAGTLNVTEW